MKQGILLSLSLLSCFMLEAQPKLMGTFKTAPGASSGYLKTAIFDMTTKSRLDLDTVHGATTVLGGETTYDPVHKIYYTYTSSATSSAIHGIDSLGHVISAVVPLGNIDNIEYNLNTGKIMGIHRLASGTLTFATMDLSTGSITDGDTLRSNNTSQGSAAFDPYNSMYYVWTLAGILKIDANTGHTTDTLVLNSNTDITNFEYDPVTDRLIGLRHAKTPGKDIIFCAMDVISKTFTNYDTVKGSTAILFSENTFDPLTRTYFGATGTVRVVSINVATGVVTDTVGMARPEIYGMELGYRLPIYVMSLQPLSQAVNVGSNVQFSVSTTAPLPSYQWQVSTSNGFQNIANGGNYSGATAAALNLAGTSMADDHHYYRCLITSGGFTWPSKIARLDIKNVGVGVSPLTNDKPFVVAPNPATNQITIHTADSKNGTEYNIYNQSGTIVLSGQLKGTQTVIDLANLPAGIYIVNIAGKTNQSVRVLKH